MPIEKIKGLKGLRSFSDLSSEEQDQFVKNQEGKLSKYRNPRSRKQATEIIYNNQKFKDIFGIDKFNSMNDGSEESYNARNIFLKDFVVNREFKNYYDPKLNKNGFSQEEFEKYNQLSTDAKLKLMESNYLTPNEFNNKWERHIKEINDRGKVLGQSGVGAFMPLSAVLNAPTSESSTGSASVDFLRGISGDEAGRELALDKNNRILEKIYNDDVDNAASKFASQVANAYYGSEIATMSDTQVKKAFVQAINGNPRKGDLGIPELASHYGNGTESQITSEMRDFSIDDMRQVLAKKKVYDTYMSPDMAMTALNNDAKRYIRDHQGSVKRFGLFLKDVGISSMSYTIPLNHLGLIYD